MVKTLDELKAENAAAELTETETETETTPIVEEEVEEEVETEGAGTETDDLGEDNQEEVLEPWMQTESETSETVPVSVLAKTRSKLKAKVSERDDEISKLRQELEQLKNGSAQPQKAVSNELPPRPTREQFDWDDDAYDQAVDEWQLKQFEAIQQSKQQESNVAKQQQEVQDRINQATESHYQRAEKLVESGVISSDAYLKADTAVRKSLDDLYQGQGDQVTDAMIMQLNSLGEGSEKVMYYLGQNPSALKTLKEKLQSDPTSMQAMLYLGTLQSKVTSAPTKKTTSAPKPGTQLSGSKSTRVNSAQKKYQAAHKSGNTQLAFNIKREARQAGVDTSNW